tara:strand:+ start:74 stop:409 length:336 start_codon:yes stop_codon:yes gene_type:complete
MGLNSTTTAWNFGQLGSGFSDEAVQVTPPTGKKIVAITFLADTVLSTLVASTDTPDTAYFSHTTAVTANGGGAAESDGATSFPAGLTIYGRWDSFTPPASTTGGVIFYFGY